MTTLAVLAEQHPETRVGLSVETAKKFIKLGCRVNALSGAGQHSNISDDSYKNVGVRIFQDTQSLLKDADIVMSVRRPLAEHRNFMKKDAIVIAMLEPYSEQDDLQQIASAGLTSFAMELMPRITRAQSMDVLSSQSNLAGYKAVIEAAHMLNQAIPMMMTAAGTVPPTKIFVMGAGVAGLQAIATARRLGAIVTATDVRPAAKEQVNSLGAKFIAVEDEEFKEAETAAGYAKEMSDEYKKKQAELVASHVQNQDVIVTTALIPGRSAPVLVTKDMVETMPSGSVIVDLAAERGGNCELTQSGEVIQHNGVTIFGKLNLAGGLAKNASSLYARNLYAFVETMLDKDTGTLSIDWDDDVITGTLVTKDGAIVHPHLTQ
ncbi:MAG: Re/Si-specific NAD(P)(+) transhydrogenase subunit alpha [Pseudomonadota bacterium]